jgi:polyphosphate kinase 2 (PPK2 family)
LVRSRKQNRLYADYLLAAEEALARTTAPMSPWRVIEATDPHYTWQQVCEATAEAMAEGLRRRGIDPDTLDAEAPAGAP